MAELVGRLPAINHPDARGDGRIPVAHQVRRLDCSLPPGPVNHPFPTPKRPQRHAVFISDDLQFRSVAPARVLVHNPSRSKTRPPQLRLRYWLPSQPAAHSAFDEPGPLAALGVTQPLRRRFDG